jgi:mRNA-degrading endonuclease toxin of MazEF toxin-antitoxin module
MSPRWRPQRGEIVLVNFPFVDTGGQPQAKLPPAVVVSGQIIHQTTADVLIAAISSRPASHPLPTDYEITIGTPEHRRAGLKKTSWVKASNLANIPRSAVTRRLGRLTLAGIKELDKRLKLALELS